ncbi:hypothetical protein N7456_006165 [Penicillium angulare]|uniref:Uncharacterized protein n=1 Tax=Penicillium angulare TaxID=116970 RepID=A0A9W9G0R2_9EURO|nr:hypothetical protein N7456_006165 [Penicillium angulare]
MPISMKDWLGTFELSRPLGITMLMHPLIFFFAFSFIFLYHTRHEISIYQRKFHKRRIFLYIHIATGATEAFRYRLNEMLHGPSDTLPDSLGVLSCFIWGLTSLELVKTLRRGDPRTTRPPYQAGAILRPVVCLASYVFGIPALHRLSISALDSFIYARLAIFFFAYTPYIRSYSSGTIYAISIPLAAALSIHESQVPGASIIYVLTVSYITRLNEWVTHESRCLRSSKEVSSSVSPYWKSTVLMLINLGFVELEELRIVTRAKELENIVVDEYVPNKSMDLVG